MHVHTRAACGRSYRNVEAMIHKIVNGFVAKFGGQPDDYLGPAHEGYMRAYEKWEPDRGAFTTIVWWCVRNKLLNYVTRRNRIRSREIQGSEEKYLESPEGPRPVGRRGGGLLFSSAFDLRVFAGGLSDDARTVVALLCDEPVESVERLNGAARQEIPGRIRGKLWDDLGWSMDRVTESFSEIREALR